MIRTADVSDSSSLSNVYAFQNSVLRYRCPPRRRSARRRQSKRSFVIGLLAGRGEWFIRIPSAIGSRWFVVGAAAFVAGIGLFFVRDRLPEGINFGVVWGFFEGFVCVGMILGLTVFFRRWLNQAEPLLAYLEGQVYGVYIVHFFVVVALQSALLSLPLAATLKFILVTLGALLICFNLVAAVRLIPIVRRVI